MLKKKHILVIDDDDRLSNLLKNFLFKNGYLVDAALDTEKARIKMSSILYDLLILDVMMPKESGLTFAKNLKNVNSIPILMLSAMGEAEDRIKGLKVGVDEYLAKPFEPEELLLRIENVFKRNISLPNTANSIILGKCFLDLTSNSIIYKNLKVKLTINETKILIFLFKRLGSSVQRSELASIIQVSDRAIDVVIKRLRNKISIIPNQKNMVLTSRGIGYRMELDIQ